MYNKKNQITVQFIYLWTKKRETKIWKYLSENGPLSIFLMCQDRKKNKNKIRITIRTARKNKLYFRKYIMCYISGRDTEVDKTGIPFYITNGKNAVYMSIERETPGIDFSRDWKKNNIFHQENIKFGHVTSDYRSCVPIFLLNKNIYWVFLWTCLFCYFLLMKKIKNIYLMRWTFFHWKIVYELYISIFCYEFCWRKAIIWAGKMSDTYTFPEFMA